MLACTSTISDAIIYFDFSRLKICSRTVRLVSFDSFRMSHWRRSTVILDGIAVSVTLSFLNYFLLGFQFPVDGFYMHSFEIWLATTVVFFGLGNIGYALLQYRLGQKNIVWAFLENLMWIPFL